MASKLHPSDRTFAVLRKNLVQLRSCLQDYSAFLERRAQIYDVHIKYRRIKYHNLWESRVEIEQQIGKLDEKLSEVVGPQ